MLYADKQALETDLKVSLLAIRERELNLYTSCFRNIGTMSGVFAGFAYEGCCLASYFFPPDSSTTMRSTYLFVTTIAMDLNVAALFAATVCAALGPGLALRGPDGSMERAVEGLALEYRITFVTFCLGVFSFYVSASLYVIIMMNWLMMVLLLVLMLFSLHFTVSACKRIYKKFRLPAHMAVGGNFNVDGSIGRSVATQMSANARLLEELTERDFIAEWPRRQWLHVLLFFDDFIGVSAEIYEARYRTVSGKHERWYNSSIASILRHLELPSHATTPGEKGAERRRRVKPRSRGGSSDGASMLGAHNNVLESDAMSPIDYHASGAISPEEELSDRSLRLQQDRPTYSDPRRPSR